MTIELYIRNKQTNKNKLYEATVLKLTCHAVVPTYVFKYPEMDA